MKCYLISDNVDTLTGMRLAGVDGVVVHEYKETADAINEAVGREDIAILAITERLSVLCGDLVSNIKQSVSRPLLVIIPDRHGSGREKNSITKYISESIGLKL